MRPTVTTGRWTSQSLLAMRQVGDPGADAVIAELFRVGDIALVNTLMRTLVRNEGLPSPLLPEPVRAFLAGSGDVPDLDISHVRKAQDLFGLYGPEMLFILGAYALPASYAAANGVKVLHATGYLDSHALRRLFETTQLVIDVLDAGGLDPGGKGIRTAQKVRLLHATIRHLLQAAPRVWDQAAFGVPINQEDLAGTLMTFSTVVMRGLERLGISLSRDDQTAYLHCWVVIGRVMGIDPALLPADMDEADELTLLIRQNQIAPSLEGRALTASLIAALDGAIPHAFGGFTASAMRFFFAADKLPGQDLPEILAIPAANWTEVLIDGVKLLAEIEAWFSHESRDVAGVIRFFSRHYIDAMLAFERGGQRPGFAIPASFRDMWARPSG